MPRPLRAGLFLTACALVLSVSVAGCVQSRLFSFKGLVLGRVEAMLGAQVEAAGVHLNGLRGFRVEALSASVAPAEGTQLDVTIPSAYVDIGWGSLFQGRLAVDQVRLSEAVFVLTLPEDFEAAGRDAPAGDDGAGKAEGARDLGALAFRVVGEDCRLEIHNLSKAAPIALEDVAFEASSAPGRAEVDAEAAGYVLGDASNAFDVNLRFASLEDFDLRVQCTDLDAGDIQPLLGARRELATAGTVHPRVQLTGHGDGSVAMVLEALFEGVETPEGPVLVEIGDGRIDALATYRRAEARIDVATVRVETDSVRGSGHGMVDLGGAVPALDLRFEADRLPLDQLMAQALAQVPADYGALEVSLDTPCRAGLTVTGPVDDLAVAALASVDSGAARFRPAADAFPEVELELGLTKLAWRPGAALPEGVLTVVRGGVRHAQSGIEAQRLSGAIRLEEGLIRGDPLSAEITGEPFVGSFAYDLEAKALDASFNGALAHIEDTLLHRVVPELVLGGAVAVRGDVAYANNRLVFDGEADLSQTDFALEWWLHKSKGVEAVSPSVRVEFVPGESLVLEGMVTVASTDVNLLLTGGPNEGRLRLDKFQAEGEQIDLVPLSQIFRVPYTVREGWVDHALVQWRRLHEGDLRFEVEVDGVLDTIDLMPAGGAYPFVGRQVTVHVDNTAGNQVFGDALVKAEDLVAPPFGNVMLVPIEAPPELAHLYPARPQHWTYTLEADHVDIQPWEGTDFTGVGYTDPALSGFKRFAATPVGGGRIEGEYHAEKEDNVYRLRASWDAIRAKYLIEHLGYPDVLKGVTSGQADYTVDSDDPDTLEGSGRFQVTEGQFSADFLLNRFANHLEDELASLPPSLRFSDLTCDFELDGDWVGTPVLELESPALRLEGTGGYYREGDIEYALKISVAPDTAKRVPLLMEAFNVKGYRWAQQDIELAFKVDGPMFAPEGEVAQLPPIGVTLVSGALEVTSEALGVIDAPRRILLDLLRVGGGIVGPGKQQ